MSAFFFKITNQKLNKLKNIENVNSLIGNEKKFHSMEFWIWSIYLFLSISLLTSLHMYEYLKCIFC